MSNIKKGMEVRYKGNKVKVVYCSLNKVKIKLEDGSDLMVSYSQLKST